MEQRARRWRLPLGVRIGAVPALVALTGALTFGIFTQSDAAPSAGEAPHVEIVLNAGSGVGSDTGPYGGRVFIEINIIPRTAGERPQGTVDLEADGTVVAGGLALKNGLYTGTTTGHIDLMHRMGYRSPGTYALTAKYISNDGHANASANTHVTVTKRKTDNQWKVSTEPATSVPGQAVQLKARLDDWGLANGPTGQVRFFLTKNGTWTEIARGQMNGHEATASYVFKDRGDYVINAAYYGDTNFSPVADGHLGPDWTHKVAAASTTTLSSATNPATVGQQPVTFTVKVTSDGKPTGTVVLNKLVDGKPAQKIADATLGGNGTAKLSATLPVGTTKLQACFTSTDGSIVNSCSKDPLEQVVTKIPSTTVVTSDRPTAELGEKVTATAKIAATGERPTGTVQFSVDGKPAGDPVKLDSSGQAQWSSDALLVGEHAITAAYSGDDRVAGSTAKPVTVKITTISTTTTLAASPAAVQVGTEVTLNATVAAKRGTPTGKVTFLNGAAELGKGDVDKDGKASVRTSSLPVGTHSLTAKFEGSDKFAPSTSQAVSVQVNAATQPGQGGGSTTGGAGGSNPQPKNLASTGANVLQPVGIGALLLIMGAVVITLTRQRRRRAR